MTRTKLMAMITAALAAGGAALAGAQPAPTGDARPGDPYAAGTAPLQPRTQPAGSVGNGSAAGSGSDMDSATDADRLHMGEQMPVPVAVVPEAPKVPDPEIDMPELLRSPTGWLLPAAVLYSKTSLDTGGGVSSTARVGLGDVAEFGVTTTDDVRALYTPTDLNPHRVQPYALATFRMGVAEHRLFDEQPGITLGFDKSFERDSDTFRTRTAELTLVASKHIGKRTAIHVGGAFWDASIDPDSDTSSTSAVTLHDDKSNFFSKQVRPFGGIQVMPIPKSEILVDLSWAPEFCYTGCTGAPGGPAIQLRPELSWGVRYEVADWLHLESGVRVPDIGNANLLNAQIFGSVTLTSWALHHAVKSISK